MKTARKSGLSVRRTMLVFPIGLILFAVIFDIVYLTTHDARFTFVAFWNMGPGVLAAFLAAGIGLWDWLTHPMGTRGKGLGLGHGLSHLGVGMLFGASWFMRSNPPDHTPAPLAIVLAVAAALLAMVGGWLGGELLQHRRARLRVESEPDPDPLPMPIPMYEPRPRPSALRPTPGVVIHPRPQVQTPALAR